MSTPQIQLEKHGASYWTATFDHPPINLIDPTTIAELGSLIGEIEAAPDLCVVVFRSADPDFFLAHYDVLTDRAVTAAMKPGPTGLHAWLDVLVRLSRAPVISIASIRGCARGAGSEFVLACDMRFASRERAVLGQFEVGVGAVPGGGPMARLARLVGRGRALEILASANDFPGDLAERYGYVNRALPDGELDAFVDALAHRLAGFDKRAIAEAKAFIDEPTLPTNEELARAFKVYLNSATRPESRARVASLVARGLQNRSDVELRLGAYVAQNGSGD
jgi:enoyl-CoA hydratase/carnithine racemase